MHYPELFIRKILFKGAEDFHAGVTDFEHFVLLCVTSRFPRGRAGSAVPSAGASLVPLGSAAQLILSQWP